MGLIIGSIFQIKTLYMVLLILLILLLLPDYKIIDPVIFSQLKITTSRHKREREREKERERERERGRERGRERRDISYLESEYFPKVWINCTFVNNTFPCIRPN